MEPTERLSLVDLGNKLPVDLWLVFRNVHGATRWTWRRLAPGFQHVEVWQYDRGAWARFDPCLELARMQVHLDPPWSVIDKALAPTFLRVRHVVETRRTRVPFHVGPLTCVDATKTLLGMWAPHILTPYQLYRKLSRPRKRRD